MYFIGTAAKRKVKYRETLKNSDFFSSKSNVAMMMMMTGVFVLLFEGWKVRIFNSRLFVFNDSRQGCHPTDTFTSV